MRIAKAAQVVVFEAGTKPGFQGWGPKFSLGSPGQRRPWFAESCDEMVGHGRCFALAKHIGLLKNRPPNGYLNSRQ
jgi:hypothetical protein